MKVTEATAEHSAGPGVVISPARADRLTTIVSFALPLGAVLLWLGSLPRIEPDRMTELGLVSVLPLSFLLSLFLLSLGFALTLSTGSGARRAWTFMLMAETVLLVLILYGTPPLVEEVPRSGTMWGHLGVADYIKQHGAVDTRIDAYFNWPGFFIGLAFIERVTGVSNFAGIGAWAPVFFNLLDAIVLLALFRFAFREERLAWLAVWVFLCTNWVGQDILSPQAFGFLIYLNIVLLLVVAAPAVRRRPIVRSATKHFRRLLAGSPPFRAIDSLLSRRRSPALDESFDHQPRARWTTSRVQRLLLSITAALLFTAVAISHQLTPYAILIVVTGFVVLNVSSVRMMPLFMALIIFTWFTYAAVPFLQQYLHEETQSLGEVRRNVSASVTGRVTGTSEHQLVLYFRLALTGQLWALAGICALIRLWQRQRDAAFIIIGLAPVVLIALQSYGGEIALRIYLFTLPATAFFVAALLAPVIRSRWRGTVAVVGLLIAFLPLFLIARYGNERIDYFTKNEYRAVRELYRISPPGSEFYVVTGNLPWRSRRYAADRRVTLYPFLRFYSGELDVTADAVANTMAITAKARPAFLIFSRAQVPLAVDIHGLSPETIARFEELVARSPRFRKIYSNSDAVIYRLSGRRRSATGV